MNNNLNRHKLLKILTFQAMKVDLEQEDILGVGWDELSRKLNLTRDKLWKLGLALQIENEVDIYNTYGIEGLYATDKGVSAHLTEKYKKENEKIIFERLKNWIQTLIPLTSLLITLLVVYNSEHRINDKSTEFKTLTGRLNKIDQIVIEIKKELKIKNDTLNLPNSKTLKD